MISLSPVLLDVPPLVLSALEHLGRCHEVLYVLAQNLIQRVVSNPAIPLLSYTTLSPPPPIGKSAKLQIIWLLAGRLQV